jgi:hypothetical protein
MSSKLNIGSVIWNATTGVEVGTIVNSTQLDLKANKEQEAWIAPTLLNGWVNFGGNTQNISYFKDEFGFVHIRGSIKSGTTTNFTKIFDLPVGYRPLKEVAIPIALDGPAYGSVVIDTNGGVLLYGSNAVFTSLTGISFKVGN